MPLLSIYNSDLSLRSRFQNKLLLEPIQPQRELHGVDSRVRRRQSRVGDVFIADCGGEGPAIIVEELEAQRGVGEKVHVRGIQWHSMITEEHAATQLQVRHSARRMSE